jgi:hypothetical protein
MLSSIPVYRNGGGIEHTPWCYTMDPLVRWQHCHIEKCGEDGINNQSGCSDEGSVLGLVVKYENRTLVKKNSAFHLLSKSEILTLI